MYQQVSHCRVCHHPLDSPFLDMGTTPVADTLITDPFEQSLEAPLALCRCEACHLIQLKAHIEPEQVFNQQYPYFSSEISALVQRMDQLAGHLVHQYQLDKESMVVELASNDGYLLQHFKKCGILTLGIEPSPRQSEIAREKGIDTRTEFFSLNLAQELKTILPPVDMIIANNVVAHVPDINDFINGIALLLSSHGTAVFEFHYAMEMIEQIQFDTIYHQHIFYFSLHSFQSLLQRHELAIVRVESIDTYGGSLRVHAMKCGKPDHSVSALLEKESTARLTEPDIYSAFADRAVASIKELSDLIDELINNGQTVMGYGAAAKASTLISVCGFDTRHIVSIVDKNPHKHGLYMPGSTIPIRGLGALQNGAPDYILILAWNYADEIISEIRERCHPCPRFILPVPRLMVI